MVNAGHIGRFISGFQVLNPDLHICTMDKGVKLDFEICIEKGRGYVSSEENKKTMFLLEQFRWILYLLQLKM